METKSWKLHLEQSLDQTNSSLSSRIHSTWAREDPKMGRVLRWEEWDKALQEEAHPKCKEALHPKTLDPDLPDKDLPLA